MVGDYEAAAESARVAMVQRLRADGKERGNPRCVRVRASPPLVRPFLDVAEPDRRAPDSGRGASRGRRRRRADAARRGPGAAGEAAVAPHRRHHEHRVGAGPAGSANRPARSRPECACWKIGTGPGYFAAVLAELVGPGGLVVTIDIDEPVATRAALPGAARIRQRHGARARRPCRRAQSPCSIVSSGSSAGCTDIVAAWLDQLVSGGNAPDPVAARRHAPDGAARRERDGPDRHAAARPRPAQTGRATPSPAVAERLRRGPGRTVPVPRSRRTSPLRSSSRRYRCQLGGLGEWNLAFGSLSIPQRAGLLGRAQRRRRLLRGAVDARAGQVALGGPTGRCRRRFRHARQRVARGGAAGGRGLRARFRPTDRPLPPVTDGSFLASITIRSSASTGRTAVGNRAPTDRLLGGHHEPDSSRARRGGRGGTGR